MSRITSQVPNESRHDGVGGGGGQRQPDRQTNVRDEPYHFKSRMMERERGWGMEGGGEGEKQTDRQR